MTREMGKAHSCICTLNVKEDVNFILIFFYAVESW